MSDYTAAEVEAALQPLVDDESWYVLEETGQSVELRGEKVEIVPVANYGGEGKGEERWVVARIGTQFFRKDGYYASHYGTDWDGEFYEVKPVEKTITVYEAV